MLKYRICRIIVRGERVSKGMLLTDEDRALLLKVSNLLEEL